MLPGGGSEEQIQNRSCGPLASRPHIPRVGQSMPLQHTVPAPPWDGTAHGVPAHVTEERGDGAIPPPEPPKHLMEECLVSRNRRYPLPAVQWGEEKSSIYCVKGPPQRFQPTRVPWQGPWHQPRHWGLAWVNYKHPRIPNPASSQSPPHGGPRGLECRNVCLQLCIRLCSRCPCTKVSKHPVPAKLALHLS